MINNNFKYQFFNFMKQVGKGVCTVAKGSFDLLSKYIDTKSREAQLQTAAYNQQQLMGIVWSELNSYCKTLSAPLAKLRLDCNSFDYLKANTCGNGLFRICIPKQDIYEKFTSTQLRMIVEILNNNQGPFYQYLTTQFSAADIQALYPHIGHMQFIKAWDSQVEIVLEMALVSRITPSRLLP